MHHSEIVEAFRDLHRPDAPRLLVLPNAWDALSARVIEDAGAPAIATTSAGVSWSQGRLDGQGLTRQQMMDVVKRVTEAVRVPVTVDIEGGYGGGTPEDVAETVRAVIDLGVVGINLEDTPGEGDEVLLSPRRQAERIAAARAAAVAAGTDLFINARTDVYLFQVGPEASRFDEVVRRAQLYLGVGADGIFVPGVADGPTLGRLAAAIAAPVNAMVGPGAPDTAELYRLGIRRASLGPAITLAVAGQIRRVAAEVLGTGTYGSLAGALPFPEIGRLLDPDR